MAVSGSREGESVCAHVVNVCVRVAQKEAEMEIVNSHL